MHDDWQADGEANDPLFDYFAAEGGEADDDNHKSLLDNNQDLEPNNLQDFPPAFYEHPVIRSIYI